MCLNVMYQRPIKDLLNERFTRYEQVFHGYWNQKDDVLYWEWVNLLSDLLCEIAYLHEFSSVEYPELVTYICTLEEFATRIQTTYKI